MLSTSCQKVALFIAIFLLSSDFAKSFKINRLQTKKIQFQ